MDRYWLNVGCTAGDAHVDALSIIEAASEKHCEDILASQDHIEDYEAKAVENADAGLGMRIPYTRRPAVSARL